MQLTKAVRRNLRNRRLNLLRHNKLKKAIKLFLNGAKGFSFSYIISLIFSIVKNKGRRSRILRRFYLNYRR
ncbi:hypothetical protein JS520_00165 [Candidatus Vidania fulgoroideae]|nr:hypothetical protein JS520_00165 [Candidatus Vidania fulgoroideae]